MIDVKASVHPLSHKQEWKEWKKMGGAFSCTQSHRLQMPTLHKDRV
nr:MAG TPA: hypothetical protein [Caudoviricetes sp.]